MYNVVCQSNVSRPTKLGQMITLDIIYGKDYRKRSYASINEFMYWTTSETQAIFNIYKSLQIYAVPSNKANTISSSCNYRWQFKPMS